MCHHEYMSNTKIQNQRNKTHKLNRITQPLFCMEEDGFAFEGLMAFPFWLIKWTDIITAFCDIETIFIVRPAACKITERKLGNAAIVIGLANIRVECNGLVEIFYCFVLAKQFHLDDAAIHVADRALRIKLQGAIERRKRFTIPPHSLQGVTEIIPQHRIAFVLVDGTAKLGLGFLQMAKLAKDHAAIGDGVFIALSYLDRPVHAIERLIVFLVFGQERGER